MPLIEAISDAEGVEPSELSVPVGTQIDLEAVEQIHSGDAFQRLELEIAQYTAVIKQDTLVLDGRTYRLEDA